MTGAGIAVVALAAMFLGPMRGRVPWAALPALDTTRIAVFPMQGSGATADLLFAGFQRWQGISLTDKLSVEEAVRGQRAISPQVASRIAERLGAGRYVLARVDSAADGTTLYGTLYDVRSGELHHVQRALAVNGTATLAAFAALADSLLLRGAPDDGPDAMEPGSRNLEGPQLMIQGGAALRDWDLVQEPTLHSREPEGSTRRQGGRRCGWPRSARGRRS